MTVDLPGLAKWIADHPGRDKPYDAVMEERMAAAADGRSLRALPTDPAVRTRGRRDVADEAGFVRRNDSWTFEPYSGEAS